jgi:hypothetical protein
MQGVATIGKLYSDNCGFCNDMKDEWDVMSKNTNGKQTKNNNIVKFNDIEAENMDNDLAALNETLSGEKVASPQGYPTVFKHENGKVSYYTGKRLANDMTRWVLGPNERKRTQKCNGKRKRTKRNKSNKRNKK